MNFAVVSNDAGSSELLCALIAAHPDEASWHIFAAPESPMAQICTRYALPFTPPGDPAEQLGPLRLDALLFGTGWQERVGRPYVHYCKSRSIPTVAFLDHWSNYRERFGSPETGWEANCGDFSALSDPNALALATSLGLPHPIGVHNYHLRSLLCDAAKREVPRRDELLFLSEPTDAVAKRTYGDPMHWGFTQYTALEDILERFERFGCSELTIRLHPSDTASGYETLLDRFPHVQARINDARAAELSDQLLAARVIIGFDTMALYIAALLGKAVISYLPSPSRDFLLPLPPKRQLRSLDLLTPDHLAPERLEINDFGMDFASLAKTIAGTG